MNVWVEAARPRTLTAAVAPVLVGTSVAEEVIAWRALAALVVALALQVGVNYANDLFDGIRGIDTTERTGPRRAVASGLVSPDAMKGAVALSLLVAASAGALLAVAVGYELLVVGLLCFAAALAYSGGPRPYGAAGLGELFVFVFFGLVATVGATYVQLERVVIESVLAAVPVGLLATAILVVNNLRDMATDEVAGKVTLAVRLGHGRTRTLFRGLVLGSFPWLPLIAGAARSAWPLLPFLTLPFTRLLDQAVAHDAAPQLIRALTGTARLQFAFGALLAIGLWIT
ncbi:MAG: 1,4-dihydroxy-2-naphthoate polyprenyltransferase [Actinomycetota bacterium]|nr:1,4-dihydroxy-2-naphthoate polyprenyltransferase [Actinomycetota bacterium]